ncbi:MAG: DUF459 domain-containing protein [Flavobacteriaceae bacterium]
MNQRSRRIALLVLLAGLAVVFDSGVSVAQGRDPIGSFFRSLFGVREAPPPRYQEAPPETLRNAVPAEPRQAAVPKADDARVIRVFGDSLSGGLKKGLEETFADVPTIVVEGLDRATSGLVRYDHYNWFEAASEAISREGERTDAVVMMIGLNDRQDMRMPGGALPLFSDEWVSTYKVRIADLINLFVQRGIRVYWVGLPPVGNSQLTRDFAVFNEYFKDGAITGGAVFVDVWTPFLDPETGKYSSYGPDIEGTRRQLRASDGLHFTRAGNRKLAFFVERDIRRDFLRGGYMSALPGSNGQSLMDEIDRELETGVGRVVALTGQQPLPAGLDGGEQEELKPHDETHYERVILEGSPLPAQPGRADDFTWSGQLTSALPEPDALPGAVPIPPRVPDNRTAVDKQ